MWLAEWLELFLTATGFALVLVFGHGVEEFLRKGRRLSQKKQPVEREVGGPIGQTM